MTNLLKKITKPLWILVFVSVALLSLNVGMHARDDGTMSGCVFDQSVTCPMDYREHIDYWQQTFTTTQPAQKSIVAFLVVFALCGGVVLLCSSFLKWQRYAQKSHSALRALRREREITSKLFDHLLQALSKGRINPRLYNHPKAIR